MSPPIVPNAAFITPFPITPADLSATVTPNGVDDWDNLMYAFTNLAGKPGAQLTLLGTYYHRYALLPVDCRIMIQGGGALNTVVNSGTPTTVMEPLDAADQAIYNPSGVPSQLQTRAVAEPHISLTTRNVRFATSVNKGHQAYGTQFGSIVPNFENAEVISNILITGRFPVLSMNNVPLALQDGVATPCGSLNLVQPQLRDAIDVGTVRYTEGVDYTVDRALGTFTAILGGAITPVPGVGNVFAHWNDINNGGKNEVARTDFDARECIFSGAYQDANSLRYSNVENSVSFSGGYNYGPEDVGAGPDVFHNQAYLDVPALADKFYNQEGTFGLAGDPDEFNFYGTPFYGQVVVEDCVWSSVSLAARSAGVERFQAGSPYTYLTNTLARSSVAVRRCSFLNCGWDAFGFNAIFVDEVSGADFDFNENSFQNCYALADCGMGQSYGTGVGGADVLRLPGWAGATCTLDILDNVGLFSFAGASIAFVGPFSPPSTGTSLLSIVRSHLFLGASPPDVEGPISALRNVLEFLDDPLTRQTPNAAWTVPTSRPQVAVLLDGIVGPVVAENRLVSKSQNQAQDGIVIFAGTWTVRDNDFSEWQKRGGSVDISVGAASINTAITALATSDSIRIDPGAVGTVVSGGTVVP